jgi:hypothetical protein
MSVSLIVASLLTAGWNLTLTATALFMNKGLFQSSEPPSRVMARSTKHVRAEVGTPDLDARSEAWKRNGGLGTAESVLSRITESQREVTMEVPYAEASVPVADEEGTTTRRCSVCMN